MKTSTLIFDYVCAVCWGQLIEDIDQHSAICARYGMDHAGYHRRSGVDWQRGHSGYDLQEVIRLYQDVKPFNYMLADFGRRYHSKSDAVTSPTKSGIEGFAKFASKLDAPLYVISNGINLDE